MPSSIYSILPEEAVKRERIRSRLSTPAVQGTSLGPSPQTVVKRLLGKSGCVEKGQNVSFLHLFQGSQALKGKAVTGFTTVAVYRVLLEPSIRTGDIYDLVPFPVESNRRKASSGSSHPEPI